MNQVAALRTRNITASFASVRSDILLNSSLQVLAHCFHKSVFKEFDVAFARSPLLEKPIPPPDSRLELGHAFLPRLRRQPDMLHCLFDQRILYGVFHLLDEDLEELLHARKLALLAQFEEEIPSDVLDRFEAFARRGILILLLLDDEVEGCGVFRDHLIGLLDDVRAEFREGGDELRHPLVHLGIDAGHERVPSAHGIGERELLRTVEDLADGDFHDAVQFALLDCLRRTLHPAPRAGREVVGQLDIRLRRGATFTSIQHY